MTKEQKLPKWFNGDLYNEGGTVANRFTGEEIELNNLELSMYDFIMGATYCMEIGMWSKSLADEHQKGLRWFIDNNAKAYMVLLD
jgi:hypothetical protein